MNGTNLTKKNFTWHGDEYFLLGKDNDDQSWYLKKATFDCDWYWGIGYVNTFTNSKSPEKSRDILEFCHFDYLLINHSKGNWFDSFNAFFKKSVLNEKETWKFIELMKSLYTARVYSDFLHRASAGITSNPCNEVIQNEEEYQRINKMIIPSMLNEVYKLLKGESDGNS